MRRAMLQMIPLAVFLLLWEAIARAGFFHATLFPSPSAVCMAFVEMVSRGEMLKDVVASGRRAVVGSAHRLLGGGCQTPRPVESTDRGRR